MTHLSSLQRYNLKALRTTISYKHTVDPPWARDTERARTLHRYKQTTKRNISRRRLPDHADHARTETRISFPKHRRDLSYMNRPKKASKTLTFQLGAPPTFANTSNCQTAGSLPYAPPFYYSCSSPQTHTHLLPSSSILYVSFIDPVPFSRTRHCRPCKLWWKLRKPSPVSWRSPNPKGGKVEKWKSGKVETWKRGNVETWKRGNVETWKRGNVRVRLRQRPCAHLWPDRPRVLQHPLHHANVTA